jgi:arylsulfatase A-like enzyme
MGMYRDTMIAEPATLWDDGSGRVFRATDPEMTIALDLMSRDLKLEAPAGLTPEQQAQWDEGYAEENTAFRAAGPTGDALTRWKYQRYITDYLRVLAGIDTNVGRILDALSRTGLEDETIVIYLSDQGFFLGDHGWFDKRWMYEESLRMPLVVRWPKVIKPGGVDEHLAQNLDFAETFLEIAGAEIPDDMQGQSLVPLLKGESPGDWRRSIYYQYYEYPAVHMVQRHYGVRTGRHKLIHYYLIDEWELFDLEKDPDELKSVYDDPTYADVRRKLTAELTRLRELYKADQFGEPPPEGN